MTNNTFTTISDAVEIKARNPNYTIAGLLEVLAATWITPEQWNAIRRAVGLQLDPDTAEAMWMYSEVPDGGKVTKEYFFRSPGSDDWLRFEDLPMETRGALAESSTKSEIENQKSLRGHLSGCRSSALIQRRS